jgi:hypothetical protein
MKSEKEKLAAKTVDQLKAAAKRLGGKLVTPDGKAKTKQQLINTIVMKQRLAGKSMGGNTTTKKVVAKKTVAKKTPARKALGGQNPYNLSLQINYSKGKKPRKIVLNDTAVLYVEIGAYTYYFENNHTGKLVDKYKTADYK